MVDSLETNAMKHLAFRAGLNAAMFIGYSTLVLGNPISNNVLMNAAAASGSAVLSESMVRYAVPSLLPAKSQGIQGLGWSMVEAAGTGVIYSQVFPRVFPALAGAVDRNQLAMVGFGIDLGSQILGPRVAALMEGGQTY